VEEIWIANAGNGQSRTLMVDGNTLLMDGYGTRDM
jgi:hypothetical protein